MPGLAEAQADIKLVERTLSGDLDSFGELHRRYYHRVVQVVFGVVRDRILAEDMVQDAYVAALKELPRLREPERFYPWLCRIAVNRAIEDRRKVSRRARIDQQQWQEQRPIDVAPAEAETSLLRAESAEAVKAGLERLPEGQRAAVTMRFFDELPMRAIAETLGCNEVTARTQVFRGIRKLGVFLKARKGVRR